MKLVRLIAISITIILLTGCLEKNPIDIPVASFNFSSHDINSIWVNGKWAGLVRVGEGGGQAGWVSLPADYKPGTTIIVDWERNACAHGTLECAKRDKNGDIFEKKLQRIVTVPFYDSNRVAVLQLAFLPNDDIRAYAESRSFKHPDHPSHKEFGALLEWNAPLEGQWPNPKKNEGNIK
ncbi:DUF3304 domain-containing protein [Chromobacterium phragmitis]|uniref:DUF3304 domain-containing protein n=1 Tax=Chromobacterium phragmitis TaxID=2202141 RepID=A0ABV0ITF4_9NEIS